VSNFEKGEAGEIGEVGEMGKPTSPIYTASPIFPL